MKKLITIFVLIAIAISFSLATLLWYAKRQPQPVYVATSPEHPYIAKASMPSYRVRFLVLKHCPDNVADTDANQAVQAANLGAEKGLDINTIGNFHIDKEGKTNSWHYAVSLDDLEGLTRFISSQMKVEAEAGDTLVIYTLGHGSGSGTVMRLGHRKNVMNAIARAAEENNQETLWWQLSCHAAAELPPISSLNEKQQELFSMTASSPANKLSYFTTQGKQFAALFSAMAEESADIDPDRDGIITAGELKGFMIKKFGQERGSLVYARSEGEVIFGLDLPNRIPIIDRNNQQGDYPRNYIPFPK